MSYLHYYFIMAFLVHCFSEVEIWQEISVESDLTRCFSDIEGFFLPKEAQVIVHIKLEAYQPSPKPAFV